MKIHVKRLIWPMLCLLLVGIIGVLMYSNDNLKSQKQDLLAQLEQFQESEGKSHVVERISKQMEDIAYQQKDIAEKQREEAVFQMGVAKEMRARAEEEQRKAEEFAQNVVEARNLAESQRELAVQQRSQAEHARNVADTLSNVALGRALALLSNVQYRGGDKELAALMAYAAWRYTSDYRGDIYQPTLFSALEQSSESFLSRNILQGGVTRIVPAKWAVDTYLSVSNYGEIMRWHYADGNVDSRLLFSNPAYSFRDVYADGEGVVYALSREGTLVMLNDAAVQTFILPDGKGWMRICPWSDGCLLLVSSSSLCLYDPSTGQIRKTEALDWLLTAVGERDGHWWAFGKDGSRWMISDEGTLLSKGKWPGVHVTAFVWSSQLNQGAVGTESGNIYIVDARGNTLRRLIAHRSRITQLEFRGQHLFSTSYDCTVNLWNASENKQEAVTLCLLPAWVHCFCFSQNNMLWAGDESGTVSRVMIEPNEMAAVIRSRLKRDFTDEEWTYYVGKDVPRKQMIMDNESNNE